MTVNMDVDVFVDIDVDVATDMNVNVAAHMGDDGPCIYGPISNLAQIF
jgi:hypothetical protein